MVGVESASDAQIICFNIREIIDIRMLKLFALILGKLLILGRRVLDIYWIYIGCIKNSQIINRLTV